MNLYIALCDDEQKTIESEAKILDELLSEKDINYELKCFTSPKELLAEPITYDMVFLDIEMSEMSGIELAQNIGQQKSDCFIFFLTNYPVYLDKAFDVRAFRYLTKPVDRQRLSSGIDKVIEAIQDTAKIISIVNFENKLLIQMPIASIIYIENTGRRTRVISTRYDFIAEDLFSALKNKIEKEVNYFATPHKSFFVNLKYVTGHNRRDVRMSYAGNSYTADMSRRRFHEFNDKVLQMAKLS